jgi:hypothetical protein
MYNIRRHDIGAFQGPVGSMRHLGPMYRPPYPCPACEHQYTPLSKQEWTSVVRLYSGEIPDGRARELARTLYVLYSRE